ncbi:MAG: hypothetical protein HY725_22830 [Candidatus Rokubacteria bacterium]|nr:hypothetical protein [Candidatus Rokubacteria bacterium]
MIAFVIALSLGILAAPLAADAQQPGKVPRVGLLTASPRRGPSVDQFPERLRDLGHVEGQNLAFQYRAPAPGEGVMTGR